MDASQQKKTLQKTFFRFRHFWPFLVKKQPKLTNNEENLQNPKCLMKFSEIWYVDDSQQKNITKTFFDFGLFWPFFNQKTAKLTKN